MPSGMIPPSAGAGRPDAAGHWTDQGACADPGVDPELFFPLGAAGLATFRQVEAAKAICARCPVVQPCRDWAVTVGEPDGIWGGTTPDERRHLRRQLTPVA